MRWNTIFELIVHNTLSKLNSDFRSWKLRITDANVDDIRAKFINNDIVSLLMETTVTSSIFTEFLGSSFTNGIVLDGENRHYQIIREHQIWWKNSLRGTLGRGVNKKYKQVDFITNRCRFNNNQWEYSDRPGIIEAKRVQAYVFKDGSYVNNEYGDKVINDIKKDIAHLKILHNLDNLNPKTYPYLTIDGFYTWLLLWDFEKSARQEAEINVNQILRNVFGENYNAAIDTKVKWIPTEFSVIGDITGWTWFLFYEIVNPNLPQRHVNYIPF